MRWVAWFVVIGSVGWVGGAQASDWYIGGALLRTYAHERAFEADAFASRVSAVASGFWDFGGPPYSNYPNGIGGHLEAGRMRKFWSAYLAYRHAQSGLREHHEWNSGSSRNRHRFDYDRFLLGARIFPPTSDSTLVPVVGAAAAFGWVQRRHSISTTTQYGSNSSQWCVNERQRSTGNPGWLLEAGFMLRPRGPLFVTALAQYENLNTTLPDSDWQARLDNAWVVSVHVGVYYRFS